MEHDMYSHFGTGTGTNTRQVHRFLDEQVPILHNAFETVFTSEDGGEHTRQNVVSLITAIIHAIITLGDMHTDISVSIDSHNFSDELMVFVRENIESIIQYDPIFYDANVLGRRQKIQQIIASQHPTFAILLLQKIANYLWQHNQKDRAYMVYAYYRRHGMIDIHPGASIAGGVFFDHLGHVAGEATCIGRCVRIYQNVTLGASGTRGIPARIRHPYIGDHTTLGANATILSSVVVGGEQSSVGVGSTLRDSILGHNSSLGGNIHLTGVAIPANTKVLAYDSSTGQAIVAIYESGTKEKKCMQLNHLTLSELVQHREDMMGGVRMS